MGDKILIGNMGPPAKTHFVYSLKIRPINTLIDHRLLPIGDYMSKPCSNLWVCTLLGGTKRNKPQSVL